MSTTGTDTGIWASGQIAAFSPTVAPAMLEEMGINRNGISPARDGFVVQGRGAPEQNSSVLG